MSVIVSLHGVRSRGKWQKELGEYIIDSGRTDIYYHAYKYGFLPAYFVIFPFIRRYYINRFRKYLYKKIYPLYGEDIAICAHSFGTYIAFHALKDSLGVDRLILFGSVLHCREDFKKIVPDKIECIDNFHSKTDEVCMFNPLGHAGAWGFRNLKTRSKIWKKHPYGKKIKITNHKCLITEHTQWFPKSFSDILKLLD